MLRDFPGLDLNASELIVRYPHLAGCRDTIIQAMALMVRCFSTGGKLLVMGNGGSAADAEHFCGELTKGFCLERLLAPEDVARFSAINPSIPKHLQNGLPAMSLTVAHALMTAYMNDVQPDYVFAQQVWVLARPNDIVIGISTSGNSKNVVLGLQTARAKGIATIALTGARPSRCSEVADMTIQAPETETYKVQELHLPIYHAICFELERYFFAEMSSGPRFANVSLSGATGAHQDS